MVKKGVVRFSVSTPPNLLKEFDEVVEVMGYDRSRAVQLAMRNFITEYRWTHEVDGVGLGALVTVYDHEYRGLEEALTEIQHESRAIVNSSMHVHLDERRCLEIIAVKGGLEVIRNLAQGIMGRKGVEQLKLAVVTGP